MKKQHKKRSYLVNFRYQLSQAAAILFSHLLVALLTGIIFSWFYLFMLDRGIACNHNRLLPLYLLGLALVVTAVTTFWIIRKSHGVAGAMNKIDKILTEAARENFPDQPVSFRRKDHFPELAEPVNHCLIRLKNILEERKKTKAALIELRGRLADGKLNGVEGAAKLRDVIAGLTENKGDIF